MSTARLTIKSLLGTINTTATTVTNVVSVVNDSVGMVNAYVSSESQKQRVTLKANSLTFKRKLQETIALEEMNRRVEITQATNKSPEHLAYFQSAYAEIEEALKDL